MEGKFGGMDVSEAKRLKTLEDGNTKLKRLLGIEAGQVVLAGSFIRPVEARHGDTTVGDFGPYGTVSLFFE